MRQLKLRRVPPITMQDKQEKDRLVFPAKALAELDEWRKRQAPRLSSGLKELEAQIDATFDRMQRQVNQLRDDVDNYRFPIAATTDHSPRPRAA